MALLDLHGAVHATRLLPLFESHLERKGAAGADADAEAEARFDLVREGAAQDPRVHGPGLCGPYARVCGKGHAVLASGGLAAHPRTCRPLLVFTPRAAGCYSPVLSAFPPPILPLQPDRFQPPPTTPNHPQPPGNHPPTPGVVVLLGTIAAHLPPGDPKRASALDLLLSVLGTPSESVQRSVSNCLPPLVAPLAGDTAYTQVGAEAGLGGWACGPCGTGQRRRRRPCL
jgi:hypothetical protein